MGRRKKGRKISGWVIVDKPLNVGSTEVVSKVRWTFNAQKAGHAGTLDPLATGVLAVALGEATKTVSLVQDGLKRYQFTVKWGEKTSTDDQEGCVIARSNRRPTAQDIKTYLPQFEGLIEQVPPQFSAIKSDGQRAYDLARAGETVELKARPIWIEKLVLLDHQETQSTFSMTCGKGGYVRSVARDLGDALGCYGHVIHLRREISGAFDLAKAITWDTLLTLRDEPDQDQLLLPLASGLRDVPRVVCDISDLERLHNGGSVCAVPHDNEVALPPGSLCWISDPQGAPHAIGMYCHGEFQPKRIFNSDDFPTQ